MRRCTLCGERKPAEEFSTRRHQDQPFSKGGAPWICDECTVQAREEAE